MAGKNGKKEEVKEEVQEQASTTVAEVPVGGALATMSDDMFAEDAGMGLEHVGSKDLQVPFIMIVQSNSPQVDDTDGKYIEGIKIGDFFNSVTLQVIPGKAGFEFVPCYFDSHPVIWKPNRGGLVGHSRYDSEEYKSSKVGSDGKRYTTDGNFMVDTAYHFGLVVIDGTYYVAIISMTSTQLKKSRRWTTMMKSVQLKRADGTTFNPPSFAFRYHITTVPEENEHGSWRGFNIVSIGKVEDPELYKFAKETSKMIAEGAIKAASPAEEDGSSTPKDDVPF